MFTGISLRSNIGIQVCRLVFALKRLFSLSMDFQESKLEYKPFLLVICRFVNLAFISLCKCVFIETVKSHDPL